MMAGLGWSLGDERRNARWSTMLSRFSARHAAPGPPAIRDAMSLLDGPAFSTGRDGSRPYRHAVPAKRKSQKVVAASQAMLLPSLRRSGFVARRHGLREMR